MKIILLYAIAWLGLVALAILNGWVREKIYAPSMSERPAHQVSTALGLLIFSGYLFVLTGIWPIPSAGQALSIGAFWLLMTLAFEFLFGHYVMGHSWSRLLHDYNLLAGRVWLLVLIWTVVAPYLFFRLRS